jgi:hypothetical protein
MTRRFVGRVWPGAGEGSRDSSVGESVLLLAPPKRRRRNDMYTESTGFVESWHECWYRFSLNVCMCCYHKPKKTQPRSFPNFPCDGMIPSDRRHGSGQHVAKPGVLRTALIHIPTLGTILRHSRVVVFDICRRLPAMAESEAKAMDALELEYVQYEPSKEEQHLPAIRQLISKDLSEPYSIYVYRYFLYQWGDLCYMVCSSFYFACFAVVACTSPYG